MRGGAVRGEQTHAGGRASSTTFTFTFGTGSGDACGAASFGLGASFTLALHPVRSLI